MPTDNKVIVLAGATGALGTLIADALLDKPRVTVRALVRPGSLNKAEPLARRGAEIVEVALDDDGQTDTLADAMTGAFSAISALQGGPDVIVDTQLRLLDAARKAGAARFIPSDYSMNLFGLAEGENIDSDWRRAAPRKCAARFRWSTS